MIQQWSLIHLVARLPSPACRIYGEQMVDSGSGDVLDEDEVSFPARWV